MFMKLDRSKTTLKKQKISRDDSFVSGTPEDRVRWVWDITMEVWSLKETEFVERRLFRDIAMLRKK